MTDRFDSTLRTGSAQFAAQTSALPAENIRRRGDQRLRRRRAACAALVVACVAGLSGGAFALTDGTGPHLPPNSQTTSTPTGETSDPGTPAPSTPVPSTPAPSTPAPSTSAPVEPVGQCRSIEASQAVKDAVLEDYRRTKDLIHIEVNSTRHFYYGMCGDHWYAAATFHALPGATYRELIAMQDGGISLQYMTKTPGGTWILRGEDGWGGSPEGCADAPGIPLALARLWDNCLAEVVAMDTEVPPE